MIWRRWARIYAVRVEETENCKGETIMARRRGSNRRRRRREGSGFLYKLLSVFLICAAVVAAITLFFPGGYGQVTGH